MDLVGEGRGRLDQKRGRSRYDILCCCHLGAVSLRRTAVQCAGNLAIDGWADHVGAVWDVNGVSMCVMHRGDGICTKDGTTRVAVPCTHGTVALKQTKRVPQECVAQPRQRAATAQSGVVTSITVDSTIATFAIIPTWLSAIQAGGVTPPARDYGAISRQVTLILSLVPFGGCGS